MKKLSTTIVIAITAVLITALVNHLVQSIYDGWYNYFKTLLLHTAVGLAIILLVFLAGFIIHIIMKK